MLIFSWIFGFGDVGQYVVMVMVIDNGDGIGQVKVVMQQIMFNVFNVNWVLQVIFVVNQSVDYDGMLNVLVLVVDVDGDLFKLMMFGLFVFGKFVDNGDGMGMLIFIFIVDDCGNYMIFFMVIDDGDGNGVNVVLFNIQFFVVIVNVLDCLLYIVLIGDKVVVVGQLF